MKIRLLLSVLSVVMVWPLAGITASAQDVQTKGIKAEEFIKDRPAKPTGGAGGRRTTPARKPTYKTSQAAAAAAVAPPPGKVFANVGVTLWRFRPPTSGDRTKELVEEEGEPEKTEWSLERMEEGTLLSPGQKVRLSIESLSKDGYLYVINREEYADGTFGEARLIFPTLKTPESAKRVKAGKMVYIPGPPKYFRIKPSSSSKGHVAEVLTVLVSSKPLIDEGRLANTAITLPKDEVEAWEKQWSTQATKFEMEGGVGRAMTEKEQSAATADAASLSQDDPVPQTIYRVAIKPEDALVIRLPLKFTPPKK